MEHGKTLSGMKGIKVIFSTTSELGNFGKKIEINKQKVEAQRKKCLASMTYVLLC